MTRVTPQEPHYPLATDSALMRTTKVRLAATGIEVLDVELARIGPDENPRDFLRFLEAGAELGARHVITQLPDPDRARKIDRFAELCELASPLGLTIDLEFPSWTETPDLTEATRVVRAAAPVQCRHPGRPAALRPFRLKRLGPAGASRANGSTSPTSATRRCPCPAPSRDSSTPPGSNDCFRARAASTSTGSWPRCRVASRTPWKSPGRRRWRRSAAKEHARLAIAASRAHLDRVEADRQPRSAA